MKFTVEINLGDEEFRTGADISVELEAISEFLLHGYHNVDLTGLASPELVNHAIRGVALREVGAWYLSDGTYEVKP